jgi:hypothetical protein
MKTQELVNAMETFGNWLTSPTGFVVGWAAIYTILTACGW